VCGISLITFIN